MAYPAKIATCCHCGTQATLKLDKGLHTLACASCGAPLRNLKRVPAPKPQRPAVSHRPAPQQFVAARPVESRKPTKKKKSSKRRKGWFGRKFKDMAEEIFDVVEDIFD